MGMKRSSLLAAAAPLLLVAACSSANGSPSLPPTSAATVTTLGGLKLPHPATWKLGATDEPPGTMGTVLGYLSTDAMHDPCTLTPSSLSCGYPLTKLAPNGVLIGVSNEVRLGVASRLPNTDLRTVAGKSATVMEGPPTTTGPTASGCAGIGGEYQMTVDIDAAPTAQNGNVLQLSACFSGPNTSAATQAFDTMLDDATASS
jgi:hypothetical protein